LLRPPWNQPCEDKYDHISIPNSNILEIPIANALDLSDTPLCEVCRNSGSFGKRHPCGTKETCPAGACSRSPMEHPQWKSVAIPPPESPPINAVIRSSRPPCPPKPRAKAGSPLRSPRLPRPRRGSFVANQFPPPICDDLRDLRANSQISLSRHISVAIGHNHPGANAFPWRSHGLQIITLEG
jgi:hypothetical protein